MSGLFLSILAGVAGQMAAWQAWRPLEQHHRHPQHHHHATLPGPPQQQGRTGAPRCQRLRRTWSTCPSTSWLQNSLPLQLLSFLSTCWRELATMTSSAASLLLAHPGMETSADLAWKKGWLLLGRNKRYPYQCPVWVSLDSIFFWKMS